MNQPIGRNAIHQVKEHAVCREKDSAKVVQILLNAKNQAFITCKNLLTKAAYRLKKVKRPPTQGLHGPYPAYLYALCHREGKGRARGGEG